MESKSFVLAIALCALGAAWGHPAGAATFVVDDFRDSGDTNPGDGTCEAALGGTQCTLRAAIQEANALAGFDTITFSIGRVVIDIATSALPAITTGMTIDGRTALDYDPEEPGFPVPKPSVYIDGDALVSNSDNGIEISTTAEVNIYALGITGFPGDGIFMQSSQAGTIDSNWVGVERNGGINGNGGSGVRLDATANVVVGQKIESFAVVGRGNVISNNADDGVYLLLGQNNLISGNYIGLDPFSSADFGNGRHGIHLAGPNNQLGQYYQSLATGNQVGHNNGDGIHAAYGEQTIYANYVFENTGRGIALNQGGSQVGSSNVRSRNIIEANGGEGILIGGDSIATDSVVWNAWVFGNQERGIYVVNGSGVSLNSNSIWSNSDDAIRVDTAGNFISGNEVGIASGAAIGNGGDGIEVNNGGNLVSNNDIGALAEDGIDVTAGSGNEIKNNRIGTNDQYADFGNTANGIRIRAAAGSTLVQENLIGHNGENGIRDDGADGTNILLNQVGSGPAGEGMVNTGNGIYLAPGGTNAAVLDNVIGRNLLDGILLEAGGVTVCGNWIGVGKGYEYAGNAVEGIRVRGAGNHIGNPAIGCAGNVIGFNSSDGIQVESASNLIRNNYLGGRVVDSVEQVFGNGAGGILLTTGATGNDIKSNVIRRNGDRGIRVSNNSTTGNAMQLNAFRYNAGMAIDLGLDGPTPNDPGDGDTGPNKLQNTPDIDEVQQVGAELKVTYRMDSSDTNSAYPITVDFYVSEDNDHEGKWAKRSNWLTASVSARTVQFDPGLSSGYVLGMATDADGNTSELSAPIPFTLVLADEIFLDGFED